MSLWVEKPHTTAPPRETFGFGTWKDGKHVVGGRNMRLEKELFGDAEDPSKQHTGINFEKYDDIPVEATGAGVPEPVTAFTNPPLDPVLLENIGYARYANPTPVQKYSIPIVAANRDLMACAQVKWTMFVVCKYFFLNFRSRPALARQEASCSLFFLRLSLKARALPRLSHPI